MRIRFAIDESLDAVSGGRGSNTYLVPGERFHTTRQPLYLRDLHGYTGNTIACVPI